MSQIQCSRVLNRNAVNRKFEKYIFFSQENPQVSEIYFREESTINFQDGRPGERHVALHGPGTQVGHQDRHRVC